MSGAYDLVFVGLSLSSSWGNGHATTYRALLRGLRAKGRRVLFLEADRPWYAANRDLPEPDFCTLQYFSTASDLILKYGDALRGAGTVIVGSYVPDGVAVIDALAALPLARLCFYDIDTPVTLAKLERGDEDYLARRQVPLFDLYFSFSGGPTLERLEQQFGARRAQALYCAVQEDLYRATGEPLRWDFGYLGTYSADRQPALERLLLEPARQLSHLEFVVAGPQYPNSIAWPANVERIEHLPPALHASFYSRQRFTLNITRADMVWAGWSPSVRLFEAAACATPVISDDWPGLDAIFPKGKAILVAKTSADVAAILTQATQSQRNGLAQASHAIVLASHTGTRRAEEMLGAIAGPARQVADHHAGRAFDRG